MPNERHVRKRLRGGVINTVPEQRFVSVNTVVINGPNIVISLSSSIVSL